MQWQMHEAKHGFNRLVHRALAEGPQVVTRHGEALVVVVSAREYTRLTGSRTGFKEFLLTAPDLSTLDLERGTDEPREMDW